MKSKIKSWKIKKLKNLDLRAFDRLEDFYFDFYYR